MRSAVSRHLRTVTEVSDLLSMARTKEIFDIIVDYPDSLPALHDLKVRHIID